MKTYFRIILFLLITLKVVPAMGQPDSRDISGAELDSSIIYGQLPNGLRYYIKPLQNYNGKLNLRFYVKAGSLNEDPDQMNFSHFTEHMAFKSSDNFEMGLYNDLKLLKKLGLTFHDFGGHSGPYYTHYKFKVPQENPEALKTGLRWFGDIAGRLHLKDNEIDEERGVMIQEVISRSGDNIEEALTQSKLQAQLVPCKTDESNFIAHQENFNPGRLRQFYKDWYRPDLMAILIAGKIDNPNRLIEQIERNFSHISPKPNPKKAINCDSLFFNQPPRFAVVANKADSLQFKRGAKFEFYFRDPLTQEKISELDGLKRLREMNLLVHLINKRLREKTNTYNNFSNAHIRHLFKKSLAPSSLIMTIDSKNENEQKVIQQNFEVLRQLQKYGVLKEDFEEAVEQELISLENRNKDLPRYWLTEMENHFVYDEYLPENKLSIIKNWLENYHIEDFQEFLKGVNLEMPEDIGILVPTGHPALSYSEIEVRSWINSIKEEGISPYIPIEVPDRLMSSSEEEKLREKRYIDKGIAASGTRELILKNGVKVVINSFKPTPGPNEKKIYMHGFRKNGALNFPAEDYFSAINAPDFIKNSGLREYDKFQLQKYLSNTSLWWHGIKPYIKEKEAGIKIDADLEDLETMLQVVHSYFSGPGVDSAAFQDWIAKEKVSYHDYKGGDIKVRDLNNNIKWILKDNSKVLTGTERYKGLDKTDMKRGLEIYRELFGSAKDFTFLISGNFSVDSVIPLLNKYLGNLPDNKDRHQAFSIEPYIFKPEGPILIQFSFSGLLDKNNYMYKPLFVVPDKERVDWKQRITADALGWVLSRKVIELRFAKNYSLYSVHAYSVYNEAEKQIEFGAFIDCLPEEYPLLKQEYLKMISEFKDNPVPEELFEQGIKRMLVEYDASGLAGTHEAVQTSLYNHYRHDMPWVELDEIIPFIESLTPKDLQMAAQKYFSKDYLYEFVMTN